MLPVGLRSGGIFALGVVMTGGGGGKVVDLPLITGTAATEQTLTVTPAVWSKEPDSIAYQWYRADAVMDSGDPLAYANEEPIPGATGTTYVIAIANEGDAILVAETATFGSTEVTVFSLAVGPIEYTDILAGTGAFDSASGWNLNADISITGGQLIGVVGAGLKTAMRSIPGPAGTYRFVGDIASISGGQLTARMTSGTGGTRTQILSNVPGQFQVDYVNSAGTFANIGAQAATGVAFALDTLKIYRIA